MTHERCSELLASYVRGDLSAGDAEGVRTHLESCDDCRAEERAVATLLAADEPPLTDLERARLHRGLAQELFAARANADVAGAAPEGRDWRRWLVPAVASAAVLAGAVVVTLGGGGGEDDAAQVASVPERENLFDTDAGADSAEGGGGVSADDEGGRGRALSGASATQESASDLAAGPQPAFVANAGRVTSDDLSDTGRTGEPFRSFVDAYSPEEGPELYEPFLRALARAAGEAGPQVRECAETLPQDGTILPAYAALARYVDEDALVVGFVTADPGSDEFDRYLMWVWARGSCRQPLHTLFEEIDR